MFFFDFSFNLILGMGMYINDILILFDDLKKKFMLKQGVYYLINKKDYILLRY